MLNWLRKKAKLNFQSRYSIFGRNSQPEMFLTEQSIVSDQPSRSESVKLLIYNEEGQEYSLDAPFEMTLDRIKMMAIGHFCTPYEAVGRSSDDEPTAVGSNLYRLLLVKDMRSLSVDKSIQDEKLEDNDQILLVRCRKGTPYLVEFPMFDHWETINEDNIPATAENIAKLSADIPQMNTNRQADPVNPALDFKLALRRIFLTMIIASIQLIAAEEDSVDMFSQVFEQLEKRRKPKVDKNLVKQLTEMGFSEFLATKALQLKQCVSEAAEWLLDDDNCSISESESISKIVTLPAEQRREYLFSEGNDPANVIMKEFHNYVNKHFRADPTALHNLMVQDYGADVAREALKSACNNETAARALLEGDDSLCQLTQEGFKRDSPIIEAILDSSAVQVSLGKPKTLFALMVLCENPTNANVWLSDPEAHPVVSQVLRIYHAEKHKLWVATPKFPLRPPVTPRLQSSHLHSLSNDNFYIDVRDMNSSLSVVRSAGENLRNAVSSMGQTNPITMRIQSEPMSHSGSPITGSTPDITLTIMPSSVEGEAPSLNITVRNREASRMFDNVDDHNMDTL